MIITLDLIFNIIILKINNFTFHVKLLLDNKVIFFTNIVN